MSTAFVTGGSGLHRRKPHRAPRPRRLDGQGARALRGLRRRGSHARRRAGEGRPRRRRRDARGRARGRCRPPRRCAPRLMGALGGVRAHQRRGNAQRAARRARGRRPALRARRHRGRADGRQAARRGRRARAAATGLARALLRSKALAEQAVRQAGTDGLRDRRRPAALRVGGGGHDAAAAHGRDGEVGPAEVDRRRWQRHRRHARRQRGRGPVLAAEKGTPGAAYFVTDGSGRRSARSSPSCSRPRASRRRPAACRSPSRAPPRPRPRRCGARTGRDGEPPLSRFVAWVSSQECTIDISLARRELGYEPVKSRAEGMEELRREAAAA